jgi:hypothetical protein
MTGTDEPSREELLEAREQLQRQLAFVANPIRAIDRNPQLVAKLEAMIAEIEDCLSELDAGSA